MKMHFEKIVCFWLLAIFEIKQELSGDIFIWGDSWGKPILLKVGHTSLYVLWKFQVSKIKIFGLLDDFLNRRIELAVASFTVRGFC